ncbi:MAG: preprotein translocase subunit SecD [Myxococcota bacterium]|jgi:preprotein translocase subunit SecD
MTTPWRCLACCVLFAACGGRSSETPKADMTLRAEVAVDGPVAPARAVWSARFSTLSERGALRLGRAKVDPIGVRTVSIELAVSLLEPCSAAAEANVREIVSRAISHSVRIGLRVADAQAAKAAAVTLRSSGEALDVDSVSEPGALIVHGMTAEAVARVLARKTYSQPATPGLRVWIPERSGLDGTDLSTAIAMEGPSETPAVKIQFTEAGTLSLATMTSRAMGETLLVEVDGRLLTAAKIMQRIQEGQLLVTLGAKASMADADTLAALLDGGALPSPVRVINLDGVCKNRASQ